VEPEFEKDARAIFGNTLEMMEFFSKKLGVDYPWANIFSDLCP
jgi:aminopeptidase N